MRYGNGWKITPSDVRVSWTGKRLYTLDGKSQTGGIRLIRVITGCPVTRDEDRGDKPATSVTGAASINPAGRNRVASVRKMTPKGNRFQRELALDMGCTP
jgi:hypothetical protein